MQLLKYAVLMVMTVAGNAKADARFMTDAQPPSSIYGLVFAQVQLDDINESDMRRLLFYADRASRTLQTLVEGNAGRSISEQDKINRRFSESLSRLANAGERSGLSMDQVSDFYTQAVLDEFGEGFMQLVSQVAGGLDFRTLFRNIATAPDPQTAASNSGADFLNALAEASQNLDLSISSDNSVPIENTGAAVTVQTAPVGPQPLPNANAAERDIVSRIRVVQGRWELTIQQGDSLSEIASAIYGDSLSYTIIFNANTNVLNSPNIIDVGTVVVLPRP